MKKSSIIFHGTAVLIVLILLYSCNGNDTTTNTTNSNCGPHHTLSFGPFNNSAYTNTFIETGNIRVFQFSAIPLTTIDSICTFTEPPATGHSNWIPIDTIRPFSSKLVCNVNPALEPYTSNGDYFHSGDTTIWSGSLDAGLQQSYGNGPGMIYDLRGEVRFRSWGTLSQDSSFLAARNYSCSMTLVYDEYKAH